MDLRKRHATMNEDKMSPVKKSRYLSPQKMDLNTNLENFDNFFEGNDDFVDFINIDYNKENTVENLQEIQIPKSLDLSEWKRCTVESIERDPKKFDLILIVKCECTSETAVCRLQGPWCHVKLELQDIVSILGVWSDFLKCYTITAAAGFIVINPDLLISGTSVVGSLFCRRKAILQDKFGGLDSYNKVMTVGSLIHELLQIVLSQKLQSYEEIEKAGDMLLSTQDMIFTLYSSKMSTAEAKKEIQEFLPNIVSFVDKYIKGSRPAEVNKEMFAGKIDCIQDIEENIWIPQLGLKGKIDVSVKVISSGNSQNALEKKYMPLELKTGTASFSSEHKGQVILYQMMLTEIGRTTNSGLLLYLRSGIMKEIPATRNEKRDLIILRNELAYYLNRGVKAKDVDEKFTNTLSKILTKFENFELPEPINHHSACNKCPYNTICCSFLKVDENTELAPNHPLKKVSDECISHLTDADLEYFINWCGILSLEQKEIKKSNCLKDFWTTMPEERSQRGRAIIDLKISNEVHFEDGKYVHTFKVDTENVMNCSPTGQMDNNKNDLTLSGITIGEYVIVSSKKRLAIAAGFVYDLTETSIILGLERNLMKNYSGEIFIIDKYESQSGNIFNFTNLGSLLDNVERMSSLRRIVVDRIKPTFSTVLPKIIATKGVEILSVLNSVQRKAAIKALTTNEYMLIKGLPGTGKTQTLVAIIRLLQLMGKSIIITSYTHSAVDNLLIRLKHHQMKFIRLGSKARVNSELHEFSETHLTSNCETPEDLKALYSSYNIVGVTCLGTAHPLFTHRTFDYCIVDEATQAFQPTILRPLFFAKKFILVGDPEQLPPLVVSKEARNLGADVSLFTRLDSSDASSVLTLQYRMNKCITKLANELTYQGELKCGNDNVTFGTLVLPEKDKILEVFKTNKWLQRTLEKHVDFSVVFLNTKNCLDTNYEFSKSSVSFKGFKGEIIENRFSQESTSSKKKSQKFKYINYCETAIVLNIVKTLILSGYNSKNIGIIAPFRAQVELLRKLCENLNKSPNHDQDLEFSGLEVNTVDQYQGRDKEIIIYSCTKTGQTEQHVEKVKDEILEDQRRLTVAITRAKYKLIIIGDEECLKGYKPFKKLLSNVPSRCKIDLENEHLGFLWETILVDLKEIMKK